MVYLIGAIAILQIIIIIVLLRSQSRSPQIVDEINAAIKQLGDTTKHYVQVNAVLAMTESFADNPQLLLQLRGYSDQVVAAALLTRVNGLGQQIEVTQSNLNSCESNLARVGAHHGKTRVDELTNRLNHLLKELESANQMVADFRTIRAV